MHGWGYAPTIDALEEELFGGKTDPDRLSEAIAGSPRLWCVDGLVCLKGQEHLLVKSRQRVLANRVVNGEARAIAESFVAELLRFCPFVECVALSGSVASGGYVPSDDIDLDLFVPDGTKYLTYAVALGLGIRFALLHRNGGRFRKVICVNVVWTDRQTSPFVRNDASLAFELLHCRPLVGSVYFRETIDRNAWIRGYFPQIAIEIGRDLARPNPNLLGRLFGWVAGHPRLLAATERMGRATSFTVYTAVHWIHRHDKMAMERLEFLKRVKYPYEVFQD